MPELWELSAAVVGYLGLLFLIAYVVERGWLPATLARHPLTYTLSIGVYATTWTYYGSVGLAASQGYVYAAIYLGLTLSFMLAPVLLAPLLRVVREQQLTSLADLFAFRFPSRMTGVIVTLFMLVGLLPYISLQIEAVVHSMQILTAEAPPQLVAIGFCATITLFSVLFGARQVTPREKHAGLVVAIAFESLIKLVALLACAAFALLSVLGGGAGLQQWLLEHPQAVTSLYAPIHDSVWTTMLLIAFSASFLLPRQFHMIFTENLNPQALKMASWGVPVYLLLLNLPIPVLLWAGQSLQTPVPPDYYLLALARQEPSGLLVLLVFVGGISAASAMVVVESLALAAMVLNHLILPLALTQRPASDANFYSALLWSRRVLIAGVIFTGYITYLFIEQSHGLAQLGLVSFVAVTQFLPAIVGMLSWPRATRVGFLAGLVGGMAIWFLTLIVPMFMGADAPAHLLPWPRPISPESPERWQYATFWSLSINALLFVAGSLLSRPSSREIVADQACRLDGMLRLGSRPRLRSIRHLQARIARVLGVETARAEVQRARLELQLEAGERRPRQLQALYERLERNLSGLIGPQLARTVLAEPQTAPVARMLGGLIAEDELERSQKRLRGVAAELNALRRFHRQVLQDLPVGVIAAGRGGEIQLWNERMAEIAGIDASAAIGNRLGDLAEPWALLLGGFVASGDTRRYKLRMELDGRPRWLNLHRESVFSDDKDAADLPDTVLLVEDLTEQQMLEVELAHSERLASLGILAAGVAHEIGNPLTGISSIVQNLRGETDPAELEQGLAEVLAQSRRINEIVRSLLTFSHAGGDEPVLSTLHLRPCVENAVRLVRLSPNGRQMQFDLQIPAGLQVRADTGRLTQVLVNLLGNAADASAGQPGATITVSAARDAEGHCEIRVIDRGRGIPAHDCARVFEPFYTTKPPGQGTGLGLPIVYSLIREQGGSVQLSSREGRGTTVTVRLPIEEIPAIAGTPA